jgi:hypothetical protein
MAIILKAKKVNFCVSAVLFVFWYHSLNVLDTPHICNISWIRVKNNTVKTGNTYNLAVVDVGCYLLIPRTAYIYNSTQPLTKTAFV